MAHYFERWRAPNYGEMTLTYRCHNPDSGWYYAGNEWLVPGTWDPTAPDWEDSLLREEDLYQRLADLPDPGIVLAADDIEQDHAGNLDRAFNRRAIALQSFTVKWPDLQTPIPCEALTEEHHAERRKGWLPPDDRTARGGEYARERMTVDDHKAEAFALHQHLVCINQEYYGEPLFVIFDSITGDRCFGARSELKAWSGANAVLHWREPSDLSFQEALDRSDTRRRISVEKD